MLIGVVGLGAMGAPMARNLAADGDRVLAYDIDPGRVGASASGVVTAARNIAEMAARCELIVTMVWDDNALRDVVFGKDGLLSAESFTGCVVDLSTTSMEIALELGAALARRGAVFLDGAVIGGGVPGARAGASPIVISGDESMFAKYLPQLGRLGPCDFVGGQGNAKVTKIINNLLVGVMTAANAEALSLAVAAGLKLSDVVSWLSNGAGRSNVLQSYMGRYVREGTYGEGLIGHGLMVKDVSLACSLADRARFPALLSELTRQVYVACGQAQGIGAAFPSVFDYFNSRSQLGATRSR